jgi:homocysteine S-methyltransferase
MFLSLLVCSCGQVWQCKPVLNKFEQLLEQDGPIVLDGGLATQLESMGFDISGALWSAVLLESNPRAIIDAHRAYLDAGADCIISASYQASRAGFMSRGHSEEESDRLIVSAVELAMIARAEYVAANPDKEVAIVAASVGPYGATLQDGSEYTGVYDISDQALGEFHASRLRLLDQSGADVLAVETIPNFREAQILCDLLDDVSTPAWVAFACRDEKNISDGSRLWAAAALFAGHARVRAVGINCTPPEFVLSLIAEVKAATPDKAIVVYPNSGETYHAGDNSWSGSVCDFDNEFNVSAWHGAGAKLIGGCCRTGPEDIAAIRKRL